MRDRKSDAHRNVAAKKIGRKLAPNEVVDHKDEDKENNAPNNLAIKSRSEHTVEHNKTRHVSRLRKALAMQRKGHKLY